MVKNIDREIIPAVMPTDFEDLVGKIEKVSGLVKWIQIDVMDGDFVASKSWPYFGDQEGHFENIQKQDEGLPHWQDLNFSLDLMAANPEEEVPKWISAGASRVIIHIESLKDESLLKTLKGGGMTEICLAISPDTPSSRLDTYNGLYDSVQFMGIKKVGYQGEKFEESVLDKIREFRAKNPNVPIGVDGGVSLENASKILEAGANRLVSGSAIFNAKNPKEVIEKYKSLF